MTNAYQDKYPAARWQDDHLQLLDQRLLPSQICYNSYQNAAEVAAAITDMVVRGAPAIGITAAYAVVMAARQRYQEDTNAWRDLLRTDIDVLAASRPTAVNLFWALTQMQKAADTCTGDPTAYLLAQAERIHREDIDANLKMGALGSALIGQRCAVLTHCNAGALATGGYGTALGVIRSAHAAGKIERVYADETRPWMQGSRLTAWEMVQEQIPVTLITEGSAASLMRSGAIDWVIVGSDRIAGNGDVANKIGTYSLAVNARHHSVKMMVVAPASTVDMSLNSGDLIPIEQRAESEILDFGGNPLAAKGARASNPAFDVTPAELVDAIVTERGVVLEPNAAKMSEMMKI